MEALPCFKRTDVILEVLTNESKNYGTNRIISHLGLGVVFNFLSIEGECPSILLEEVIDLIFLLKLQI
jgi:hypothetical protein